MLKKRKKSNFAKLKISHFNDNNKDKDKEIDKIGNKIQKSEQF